MSTPPLICENCKNEIPPRSGNKGRPARYCGSRCRSTAHRQRTREQRRKAAADPMRIVRYDPALRLMAEELVQQAGRLQGLAVRAEDNDPDLAPLSVLRQIADLREDLNDLTAIAVQQVRAHHHHAHWRVIAEILDVSQSTARKNWSNERAVRRLAQRQRRNAQRSSRPATFEQRPPSPEQPPAPDERPPGLAPPSAPWDQLSSALSHLHQACGKPVRVLAQEASVSSSYISRLLTGERLPTWSMAQQLTVSCGGDPAEIRPLWEAARGLRPRLLTDTAAAELTATVRGLHLAAQRPSPARVCALSHLPLDPDDVIALLDGTTPDWPVVESVIGVLRGRPEDVRPLWESARHPTGRSHFPILRSESP